MTQKTTRLLTAALTVALAALCMVSCSKDNNLSGGTGADGSVPVTLSATIDHGVQTRATSSTTDDDAQRCLLQIIENDGTTATKRDVLTMTEGPDGYTASAMLDANHSYEFLFWADGGEAYYNATNLEAVTIAENATGAGIAWYGSASWSGSGETDIEVTLTHAVTKLTLQSTTEVPTTTTAKISGVKEYSIFDVSEGAVTGTDTTYSHSGSGSGNAGDVFSFYALVDGDTQTLTLQTGEQPEVSISNVPLAPNKHVILTGDVANAGLTAVNFTATLGTDWGSSTVTYIVTNAEELLAWAAYVNAGNYETNCTLAADIDMTGQEWVQVGSYSNGVYYRGTFDGGGHTISNLKGGYPLIDAGLGCTIKNVVLDNPAITYTTHDYAGGIIAYISGGNASITNCHVIGGTISCNRSSNALVGGIAGQVAGAIVSACSSTATVTALCTTSVFVNGYAGGLVGSLSMGTLTASYYAGKG